MPLSDMQYRDLLRRLRDDYRRLIALLENEKEAEAIEFLNREIKRISESLEDHYNQGYYPNKILVQIIKNNGNYYD